MDKRAALVERVCLAWGSPEHDELARMRATAAIDLIRAEVLEEAAGVVTEHYQELCTEHRLLLVNRAAAIRALKVTPSTT